MLWRLAISTLAARKVRAGLTVLAIGLSVALVVAMTSGFRAFESAAMGFMDKFMGAVDASIARMNDPGKGIDARLLDTLQQDQRVRLAFGRLTGDASMEHNTFGNPMTARASLAGVVPESDPLIQFMQLTRGRWWKPGERACVIDKGLHEASKLEIGDTVKLRGAHGPLELPIVGIVHKPGIFAGWIQSVYVPLADAQEYVFGKDQPGKLSLVRIQLEPGTELQQFEDDWTAQLAAIDPLLKIKMSRASRQEQDANLAGMRLLSYLGGAVSMISATFIIFSTLSMGVAERQRTLAMLRAIGAARRQIAKLVLIEAILLGVAGVIIGVPIGFGLSTILVQMMQGVFDVSPMLDVQGAAIAGLGAVALSIIAGLLPAWQAMRVDPLEAMASVAKSPKDALPVRLTLIALALVAVDPALLHLPMNLTYEREIRFWGHFYVGLPCLVLGFFLIAPAFVWTLTRIAGPVLCAILRVPYAVARQQISGGIWRSAGTCAALMVGLSVLVVMQTQGNSSLNSWVLPTHFPDIFIFTRQLSGLTPDAQAKIRQSELLVPEDTMPIAMFAPEVGGGLLGLLGTRLPGSTMFVAVDPDKAFQVMQLDFREGTPEEAARLLKQGRHCVVTLEFKKMRGLGVGDKLPLKSRTKGTLEYTIAGVVWSPGIDVMVNSFDLSQQFEQQSEACVFGSLDDARADFGVENVYLMAANFRQMGVPKEKLMHDLQVALDDTGVNVADVRQLKASIQKGLRKLLGVASSVAWGALLVASLGVTNTIVASVRSRMWQFGILRSIGMSRFTLLRVVLAEAILLGIIGAAMGLACGAVMVMDARRLIQIAIGHVTPVNVPWNIVLLGVGVVIVTSMLASILPAVRVSRSEPLRLLQAGRTAA